MIPHSKLSVMMMPLMLCFVIGSQTGAAEVKSGLASELNALSFKVAYECYVNDNWEIFVTNADGSQTVNLTNTRDQHEHYPQVSRDGTKICFLVDQGEGRSAVRSLWVMNLDGTQRRKICDYAREPFWTRDGTIGYLQQEYSKFNVVDFYTTGMTFCDSGTGRTWSHPVSSSLRHLYSPSCSSNGKWIAATVHAAMNLSHAILLIEANGDRIINLEIPGCRPSLSPDRHQIAWSSGEHEISLAPLDTDSAQPRVGPCRLRIQDDQYRILHADWSPDNRFLSFSRGPDGKGDPDKPGTFQGANGIVGVYAAGWNICIVSTEGRGILDLNHCSGDQMLMLTTNGLSNKEPCWFLAH